MRDSFFEKYKTSEAVSYTHLRQLALNLISGCRDAVALQIADGIPGFFDYILQLRALVPLRESGLSLIHI